jgi:hypothetical protein
MIVGTLECLHAGPLEPLTIGAQYDIFRVNDAGPASALTFFILDDEGNPRSATVDGSTWAISCLHTMRKVA